MGKERKNNIRNRLPLAVGDKVSHIYDSSFRGVVADVSTPEDSDHKGRAFQVTDLRTNKNTWCIVDELVRV